jgi:competence ComEA-like helix-hairpin-helix protein
MLGCSPLLKAARKCAAAVLAIALLASLAWLAPLAAAQKKPPPEPLNINKATAAELTQLPGVGKATAEAVVAHREKHGPFRRLEELMIIRGISRARFRQIRPHIRLDDPPPENRPAS